MKLGKHVITVTTPKEADYETLPILRLDGEILDISSEMKLQLENSSVLLDVQIPLRNGDSSTNPTMMLSFEYKSGVSVGIEVQFSKKIGRLYFNTILAPTISFVDETDGLCGFMNDDPDNDFVGLDGVLYHHDNVTDFVETWKIERSNANGGLYDSWSWNSSNFHMNDELDDSYTKKYKPIYSTDEVQQDIVKIAKDVCLKAIPDTKENKVLIASCVYDIAVTNDTSFVSQQTLQTGCPYQCSGRGTCVNNTCECLPGWSGEDCRNGLCISKCLNGECVSGFCRCNVGWEGDTCEDFATCFGINNCTDEEHGTCIQTDVCLCNKGFTGEDCSVIPTCHRVANCSGNGICVDIDVCDCYDQWKSATCDTLSCHSVDGCSGHGTCISFDICMCNVGWTGESCALPDCSERNRCNDQGECTGPNECSCYVGYQGANCSESVECIILDNCNGNGVCIEDASINNGTFSCECFTGYSGENCTVFSCESVNHCSGHGNCIEPDLCVCDVGYTGVDCLSPSCESLRFCSGNGRCNSFGVCECYSSWFGEKCDRAFCTGNCNGRGDCVALETCECYVGFEGETCQNITQENQNQPKFDYEELNITLAENTTIGTYLLTVHASDNDTGKNGDVWYRILPSEGFCFFSLNQENGDLFTAAEFDYESQNSDITLSVVAEDNGSPPMNDYFIINITLLNINDNCPEFVGEFPDILIPLNTTNGTVITNISAKDSDSGENGYVTFSIMVEGDNSKSIFEIDPDSGEITVSSYLQSGEHAIKVIASDNAAQPCSIEKVFSVYVPYDPNFVATTPFVYTTEGYEQRLEDIITSIHGSTGREDVTTSDPTTTRIKDVQPMEDDCMVNADCSNGAKCYVGICACLCPYSGPTCDQGPPSSLCLLAYPCTVRYHLSECYKRRTTPPSLFNSSYLSSHQAYAYWSLAITHELTQTHRTLASVTIMPQKAGLHNIGGI
ncbi:teneurin-3-like [Anneissia japonica]|uniref:teneurin-3-like n=1 Tax=Anneissia japonica TaxID=1529436 RepID=UPI00142565A0|nr:teneurin-3-like [Anneissia japonica]